jgi:hypothetical protein
MFKTILRFLVVASLAVALGFLIYHFAQPAGASFGSGTKDLGHVSRGLAGEAGFREGGFSLTRGVFGVAGNLFLVATVIFVVVSVQKVFSHKAEPARAR